ncbi:MAG: deaminase/reductase [Acidimicrobiaceae bacterium]|nr:deaminase/reductase [Acidimicrobiaceae bacterium]
MAKVRVHGFSLSLDGYAAGAGQDREHPLGRGGSKLHEWVFETRYGRRLRGLQGGTTSVDDVLVSARDEGIGATIMGRNMFGPVRGPWKTGEPWTGWWGSDPPYHHRVFVLTHHPRPPIEMEGGTTFSFVPTGILDALEQALAAAEGQDVLIGGGAATVRQYLAAGLVDEAHLVIVPVLLGSGERLFVSPQINDATYRCIEHVSTASVTHLRLERC